MISCPKCGFQQPKDQYCAKCGVDIDSYKPPRQNITFAVMGFFKPILIFSFIIVSLFFVLKKLNKTLNLNLEKISSEIIAEELILDETESAITMGVQAARISPENTDAIKQESIENMKPQQDSSDERSLNNAQMPPPLAPHGQNELGAKIGSAKESESHREYFLSVNLVELFVPENKRGNSSSYEQSADPQIVNNFYTETGSIKDKPLPIYFEDEILIYEITFEIKKIKSSNKNEIEELHIQGQKKSKVQAGIIKDTFFAKRKIQTSEYNIWIDTDIRQEKLPLTSLILSNLLRSQDYLARRSELALLIKLDAL